MNQERSMNSEQFEKKKKRKVRMNKNIRSIASYLCKYIPEKKGTIIKNLNILLKIEENTHLFIGEDTNPVCIHIPFPRKSRRIHENY